MVSHDARTYSLPSDGRLRNSAVCSNKTCKGGEEEFGFEYLISGVPRGGVVGVFNHPPEISKALQNCAKINPICENC